MEMGPELRVLFRRLKEELLAIFTVKHHRVTKFTNMTTITKNDKNTMMELMCAWLTGAGFSGFRFDTAFTLYFIRDKSAAYNGFELPWQIELHLLGDWWIGSFNEWSDKVERLGQGVEPDEPVKASELALLRWSDGASVKNVTLSDEVMIIIFDNKTELSLSLVCEDEYIFSVNEFNVREEATNWSVTCDGDNYYYRAKS